MNYRMMSPARFWVVFFIFVVTIVLASTFKTVSAAPPQAQSVQQNGPRIWLSPSHPVPAKHEAASATVTAGQSSAANGVALAAGDFDGDGILDLVMGFRSGAGGLLVLRRGNLDAFAPQSLESLHAIGRGDFPAPFKAASASLALPVSPDFIATGDFSGNGHLDVAIAARGGSAIYVLAGDGKGKLGTPKQISLTGKVTAMSAGAIGPMHTSTLLVGLSDPTKGISLDLYAKAEQGLAKQTSFPLSAPASNIDFGDFGEAGPDAAFLSGGDVVVLHSGTMQLEQLSLPVSATAMALGSFIYDRNPHIQLALLTSDGAIHIAAHNEFDPHALSTEEMRTIRQASRRGEAHPLIPRRSVAANGWKIVESIPGATPFSGGRQPVLFRTRITDHGSDDLMILSSGQMTVISHPDPAPDAPSFDPAQILSRPYDGSPVAALPMRTNIDGRPGVVALHSGSMTPMVMMPLPDPTFFPNRFDDPVPTSPIANACNNVSNADTSSSCSLREAVLRANATSGTDTIQLAAGTYTLTLPKVAGDFTGNHGALYVNDSVNIVGAGQNSTIVQAGTSNATGVDMVMAVNEDINPITNATASISNLTLKFGHNRGTHGNDGDGGCMEFDTGSSGNANLTLTNVTLDSCSTTRGNGGGIAIFNFTAPNNGLVTFTNSIIQNNSAVDTTAGVAATAGGIWVSQDARMSMTNSQVLNNSATQVSGDNSVAGEGGGITLTNNTPNSRQTVIHGSTISGNHAGGNGGGIHNESNLLIDQSSIISNNSAGAANLPNAKDGGGLWTNTGTNGCPATCSDVTTLNKVTITGNTTTGNGGGIAIGNNSGGGNVTMAFSRLAGNTAPVGKNLSNNSATVSVTDNWWGVNTPATTISTVGTGVTTFDPFIELTHTASPAVIKINQSSTLTGSLAQDNHGTAIAAANLTQVIGLPITFNNPVLGSIPQAQPETLNANAQATATFNAGGTSGNGHADATVDQATVTANIVILEPLRIIKSFNPTTVAVNAPSTLTFSVNNPNVIAVDGSFTDTLPVGLVVAATPGVTNTCGGTVTAVAGSGSVSFSNASLAVGTCTITVKVSSAIDSIYSNSVTINSTAAGTGALSTSSANLTVINPPSITKQFGAATIPLNGTTSLTFTVSSTNQNLTLNGITFTDNLPAGLIVATPSGVSNTCTGTVTASAGSSSVSLASSSLAPGASCTVSVNVQGTTAGVKNNSVTASDTVAGTGNTSNASITVVAPPTIAKAFGAASVPLNGTTTVTFSINNPNATVDLSGVAFSDTLPNTTGTLVVAATPGVVNTCGGTVTATAGTGVISLSGGTVAKNTSCTLSVNVTGTAAGDAANTTGAITSTEGGTGATSNTATLKIVAPPTISKAFGAAAIPLNGATTVTFTIANPAVNTTSETGIAFSDTLTGGLQVASTPGVTNNCGGTVTAAANSTSISLTGGSIAAPGSTCTIVVNVTGTQSGTVTNITGAVSSTNGGTGATSNTATLIVAAPPSITKTFGAASIPLNGTTSLTFNITNPNTNVTLNGVAFTDNLPAGLVVASTPNLSNTCGGTATAVAGSSSVTLSGGILAAGASCTVTVNVTGTTAGVKSNSVQVTSTEGGTGNTSNASITVVAAPTISKAFGAASIPLNGTTAVTFTINNPNTTAAGDLTGVAFSDTLPNTTGTLVVAATPGVVNTCNGTVTATAGTGVISLSGGTVAHGASCTLTVNVTGTAAGDANNTTGAITSTNGGTGLASNTATLKVVAPPTISKAFGAANITLNGTTTVSFTITNPASNTSAETGIAFSDTLTNGLQVASTPGVTNSCGGTVTAAANSTSISLTGGSIATPGATCTIVVNVTGTQSGTVTNTTGAISSTNGGTGATSNTATLIVASPASVTKSFGASKIPLNGTTSLTINISNPNTNVSLTGLSFTDTLPAGLVIAATPNLNNTCNGTATATAGSSSLSLSGGTVASSASCAVTVNVTGTTAGDKNNSVQVTSSEGGTSATASATVTVVAPPTIAKSFGAASIPLNGTTTVTFTISNPNNPGTPANGDLTGVAFSDTLPVSGGPGTATLVVAATPGVVNTCGGTVTATAGTGVISLSGASVAHNTSCTLSVNVTGTVEGDGNNTTGAITSTEGGTGATSNTATIKVVAPPAIAKVFSPSSIALNATTSLQFTITNPAGNTTSLNGVAFTDTLPTGLTVANGTSTVCGGTLTTTAPTGIALSGATIAANSNCQFSVTVTGAAAGSYTNTTGAVSSTNGGTGNTASANLTVATPPTINKAFGAASILLNSSTSLTFNINNPNTTLALSGVAFSDSLPAGLVVATPNGLTSTCGGTVTAAAGSGSISLTGGALAANGSCTIALNVKGVAAGVQNNTTAPISSTESGAGATSNTATITVIGPPSIAKAFGAASINLNGTTTLSFTITNPNATVALSGVAFGDTLPAGLAVANPNGLTGSCGSGTITTSASVVSLSGGTIAAGGSCTFSVNVVGTTGGHKVNTTETVTSSNAGSGNQATATIDVNAPDLAITKTHVGQFTRGQTGAQYTITVSNVGFGPTTGTVTVVDTLPNVVNTLVPTDISGTGWTCTLATLTCTRADALTSGSYPAITLTVNVPINIQNSFTNTATVSGGGDVNPNNNTATDKVTLGPPIVMTPQSSSVTVVHGNTASMVISVAAPDPTLGKITFSCSGLPSGTSCSFNPSSIDPAVTPGPTNLTVSIGTAKGTASLMAPTRPGPSHAPLYAMLAFPVFGVVLAGFGGAQRKKGTARWAALAMLGLMLLLAMAGCGVAPPPPPPTPGTPAGTSVVTITATSAGFTATTTFNLVVQ